VSALKEAAIMVH